MSVKVKEIIEAAGMSTQGALYQPYQSINTPIDIIEGIFTSGHYVDDPGDTPIQLVNSAIGVYQNDRLSALVRTISPFYWLGQIIEYLANLPFFVLDKLGFEGGIKKTSKTGRVLKSVFTLVSGIITYGAAILTILDVLRYWENVKTWIENTLGIHF